MASLYPQFYTQLSSLDSAVGLPNTFSAIVAMLIQPVGGTIRWRDDGGIPTSTVGNLLADGTSLLYDFGGLRSLQFVKASGTPVLNLTYYATAKAAGNVLSQPALATTAATCAVTGNTSCVGTAALAVSTITTEVTGTFT